MERNSAAFDLQTDFPAVIISYCSKTDGGRGEQRMWQTGPVPDGSPAEGKGMTVLFPGNKLGAQLFVSDLDLTMPGFMQEVD